MTDIVYLCLLKTSWAVRKDVADCQIRDAGGRQQPAEHQSVSDGGAAADAPGYPAADKAPDRPPDDDDHEGANRGGGQQSSHRLPVRHAVGRLAELRLQEPPVDGLDHHHDGTGRHEPHHYCDDAAKC
jgi:hypothetical protein